MSKIIHVSCLILLLFICNQIRSSEREELISREELTPIEKAHKQLKQLLIEKKEGRSPNSDILNEISNTLTNYSSQATIWTFDASGKPTGQYDTKGWKGNPVIKKQVETVRKKLGLLTEIDED